LDDLNAIVNIKSLEKAKLAAKQLFGEVADEMMAHRREILRTSREQQAALDEARKNAGTREQQMKEQQAQAMAKRTEMFQQMSKAAQDKYPEWFQPKDGDEAGNKMLEDDYAKVKRIFDPETEMNPMEQLRLHSWLYNSAAGFRRQAQKAKELVARVTELETELSKYRESEPGGGEGGPQKTVEGEATMDGIEKQIDALGTPI
jgi:predicted phage tail protein